MKTITQPTKEELKKAEQKFNRVHNRFYTALTILQDGAKTISPVLNYKKMNCFILGMGAMQRLTINK